jgi:uncharacterized membrane protein YidH (DUF202 family)
MTRLGGAASRTDQAWSRTGLAIGAVGLVVLRRLPHSADTPVILSLLAAGLAAWSIALWVLRRTRRGVTSSPMLGARTLRLVTIGVVLIAGAAFALAAVPGA